MYQDKIQNIIKSEDDFFVSIYLFTYTNEPESSQNTIRYENLLNEAKNLVVEKGFQVSKDFFKEAEDLLEDSRFWNHMDDGLAVIFSENSFSTFKTLGSLPERLVIGQEPHIIPLLNAFNFVDPSFILDISKDRFSLLHMSQAGLDPFETDLESHFDDLFEDKDFEGNIRSTDGASTSFHGHKTTSQTKDIEQEKYMRYLVNGLKSLFHESDDRLVVFGTTESIAEFSNVAKSSNIEIDKAIDKPLKSIDENDLYDVLKDHLLPDYIDKVNEELEDLGSYLANNNGSADKEELVQEENRYRLGKVFVDIETAGDDATDKIVNTTLRNSGQVFAIDHDQVEFDKEIAGIYRY